MISGIYTLNLAKIFTYSEMGHKSRLAQKKICQHFGVGLNYGGWGGGG